MNKVLFRPQRGGLDEAMAEVREFISRQELIEWLAADWNKNCFPTKIHASEIESKFYGFDDRIQWDTYIWTHPYVGVLGFTNGNFLS